jgi:PAS domain S-box-containing protein
LYCEERESHVRRGKTFRSDPGADDSGDKERVPSCDLTPQNPISHLTYRLLLPGGAVSWLEKSARAFFNEEGRMLRVIGMVADVTERKLAEERLREYEKAVEGSEEIIAVIDRKYRYLIANRKFLEYRSMTKEQVVGRLAPEVLNKEFFETVVKQKLDECFQGKVVRFETKYTYPEIGERDLFVSYFPIEGPSGVDRVACILRDITERKRAEEALSHVSRRLIEAQEQERARIARELHDDTSQRLALLAVEIEQLKKHPSTNKKMCIRLDAMQTKILDMSSDIQALSHELHSSKLEYLGIAPAMRSFCKEFGKKQKVEVDFESLDVPRLVLSDISLCLFRVLQEALHNAAKHSGTNHFRVQLRAESDEIHLTVSDSGAGFDPEAALKGDGLGLISMKERLHLVKGEISIDSQPKRGTTIHARVPLKTISDSMSAAV